MRKIPRLLTATVAAAALGPQVSVAAPSVPVGPNHGEFVSRIDNPWFPLRPGTVLTYRGTRDGKTAIDVMTVTKRKRAIAGIQATVVRDRLYLNGRLAERTTDWYAQDRLGNVWYLGEATATLDRHGKVVSTEGTWKAGTDGARAGIYMPAHPRVGQTGWQEFYKGHAEDRYRILSLSAHTSSPLASDHALLSQETTRLEPGVIDHKLYLRGIGTVREETVKNGHERLVLVSIKRP